MSRYPTGAEMATVRATTIGYRGSERLIFLARPDVTVVGVTPMIYVHGFLGDARSTERTPCVDNLRHIAAAGIPVILADYGGFATWANADVVDPGGAIDDALDYCATQYGTLTRSVVAAGESMGSWAAAAWAWRNIGRTAAVWLLAPIVDALAFFDANPTMQASINAAYTDHAGFLAARPTHDPALNVDTIRPLAQRMRLDFARGDTLIDPTIPTGWAADVGVSPVDVRSHAGGHDAPYTGVKGPDIARWIASHVRTVAYR